MTYVVVGLILLATWLMIAVSKMPKASEDDTKVDFLGTMGRLIRNRHYMWGVAAQFFYVGAQIGVWSYTIRYCMQELGLEAVAANSAVSVTAEKLGGQWYLAGIIVFVAARFVCTWLMKFITPGKLLAYMSYIVIRLDGHGVPVVLDAILKLLPLDKYADKAVALMEVVPGDSVETPIWDEYRKIINSSEEKDIFDDFEYIERFAFYECAKEAYAVIATSEPVLYANMILKKGCV